MKNSMSCNNTFAIDKIVCPKSMYKSILSQTQLLTGCPSYTNSKQWKINIGKRMRKRGMMVSGDT
jgi:hypothetical protein